MKKIMVVLVAMLTFTASVFANSPLVGKVIQGTFPLIINGEISSQEVIVVDGTSYLPVRDAGEMFGYEVGFENETVILNNEELIETSQKKEGEEVGRISESYIYESDVIEIWRRMDQEGFIGELYKEKEKLPYLVWDGEVYVPWQVLNNFRTEENTQEYPNGYKVIIDNPAQKYQPGIEYFHMGHLMIKLSLTGYNAEIRDGAVWIIE